MKNCDYIYIAWLTQLVLDWFTWYFWLKRFISIGTTAEGLANLTLDELPCGLFSIQLLLPVLYCLFEEVGLLFNYEKFVVVLPLIILIKINQKLINYKLKVLKNESSTALNHDDSHDAFHQYVLSINFHWESPRPSHPHKWTHGKIAAERASSQGEIRGLSSSACITAGKRLYKLVVLWPMAMD